MPKLLSPPDDEPPEQWLSRWDSAPTLLPTWPENARMAVVIACATATATVAYVLLNPAELRAASRPDQERRRLFFTVPRTALLAPGICAGLSAESFSQTNT